MTINPVVALKLAHGLSIAAGAMVNYADLEMEQGLLATANPWPTSFASRGTAGARVTTCGLLWQPHRDGFARRDFPQLGDGWFGRPNGIRAKTTSRAIPGHKPVAPAEFELPLTVTFGVSYRPTPKWNLEFDADYTDWSSFGTVYIHQQDPPFGLQAVTPVILNWQPSWMFGFGVTRYFDKAGTRALAMSYNQNSVPDAYYSPSGGRHGPAFHQRWGGV